MENRSEFVLTDLVRQARALSDMANDASAVYADGGDIGTMLRRLTMHAATLRVSACGLEAIYRIEMATLDRLEDAVDNFLDAQRSAAGYGPTDVQTPGTDDGPGADGPIPGSIVNGEGPGPF